MDTLKKSKSKITNQFKKKKTKSGNDFEGFFKFLVLIVLPIFFFVYYQGINLYLLAKNINTPGSNPFNILQSFDFMPEIGFIGYLKKVFKETVDLNGQIINTFLPFLNNQYINELGLGLIASLLVITLISIPLAFSIFITLYFVFTSYFPQILTDYFGYLYIFVAFIFSGLIDALVAIYRFYSLYYYPIANFNRENYFSENFNSIIIIVTILVATAAFIYLKTWIGMLFLFLIPISFKISEYAMP
jgi:hypothetical protein